MLIEDYLKEYKVLEVWQDIKANYFIEKDFTYFLGIGKLVTSITMTICYVLLYPIRSP